MPVIDALYIYPIKSCRGTRFSRARGTRWGLQLDRHWMLVDGNGRFVSQRRDPLVALIVPMLHKDAMSISALEMQDLATPIERAALERVASNPVVISKDAVPAIDEGDAVARWFSSVAGVPVRLVRFYDAIQRQVSPDWTGPDESVTQFADGFPVLVTVRASLDDLNCRMQAKGAPAISMDRFRPNLVVSDVQAYDEDYLGTICSEDARVVLRLFKPCACCPIPTIDQLAGTRDAAWGKSPWTVGDVSNRRKSGWRGDFRAERNFSGCRESVAFCR